MPHITETQEFLQQFGLEYERLYDADCKREYVTGRKEAMQSGDAYITTYKAETAAFNRARNDILVSDREVTAYGFTLAHFNLI